MANETLTSAFSDIADAIRAKGVTGTMTPLQMPTKIGSIPTGSGIKYGVSMDSILGDVDASGGLGTPSQTFTFGSGEIITVGNDALKEVFKNNTLLTEINLPELSSVGTSGMKGAFYGCTSLSSVNLPKLEVINPYGMQEAFEACTSLTTINLPRLTRAVGYDGMNLLFSGCSALKYVGLPKLSSVSSGMFQTFQGCASLQVVDFSEAKAIPQTNTNAFENTNENFKIIVPDTLYSSWKAASGWSSYSSQIYPVTYFSVKFTAEEANSTVGIASVGTAPSVNLETSTDGVTWTSYTVGNTITLANIGDYVAFRATSAKNTTMATDDSNYNHFVVTGTVAASGNTTMLLDSSFTGTTTLTSDCFNSLFKGCSGMTSSPMLPSTTLASNCYKNMFYGCTSLTTAPELPATTLASGCYANMFDGASNLSSITLGYGGNFSSTYFDNWVNGVASSGTLWYNGLDTTVGPSAIPSGWTASKIPYYGMKLIAKEANSTVRMAKSGSAPTVSLEYSIDEGVTWSPFVVGTTTVTLANIDDQMRVRATSTNGAMAASHASNYNYFVMTGQIAASGNINSLLNKNVDDVVTAPQYAYVYLFKGCTSLIDAKNLTLPCTATSPNSYGHMFDGCSNLVAGPEIFATNIVNWSFEAMFSGCSVLNEVKLHYTGSFGQFQFSSWMSGVQTTAGTFYYNGSSTTHGTNAIPNNWTITPFS